MNFDGYSLLHFGFTVGGDFILSRDMYGISDFVCEQTKFEELLDIKIDVLAVKNNYEAEILRKDFKSWIKYSNV